MCFYYEFFKTVYHAVSKLDVLLLFLSFSSLSTPWSGLESVLCCKQTIIFKKKTMKMLFTLIIQL